MLDGYSNKGEKMTKNEGISIQVDGIEELTKALDQFSDEIAREMKAAGEAAAKEIIWTKGLKTYPGETAANKPPIPFYVRGVGTQTASGNLFNSERYGSQFYVQQKTPFTTTIGNRASYAEYLGGDKQAKAMARKGWVKLYDAANKKMPQIVEIFQSRIDRLIKKLGL